MNIRPSLLAVLLASSAALAAPTAHAEGWTLLPVMNDPAFTLALTVGSVRPSEGDSDTVTALGIEATFNCILLQSPDKRIRTHLSIQRIDEDDAEVTTFELSPRYTVPLGNGLSVGVGPSLALVNADVGSEDENLFGYGVAAGLNYRHGALYAGADVRYQNTTESEDIEFENWALTLKVGVNF